MKTNKIKKVLYKIYIWAMYVLGLPLYVVYAFVMFIIMSIQSKRDYGEFDFVNTIKAMFEGLYEGHKWNMYKAECRFGDKTSEDVTM